MQNYITFVTVTFKSQGWEEIDRMKKEENFGEEINNPVMEYTTEASFEICLNIVQKSNSKEDIEDKILSILQKIKDNKFKDMEKRLSIDFQ